MVIRTILLCCIESWPILVYFILFFFLLVLLSNTYVRVAGWLVNWKLSFYLLPNWHFCLPEESPAFIVFIVFFCIWLWNEVSVSVWIGVSKVFFFLCFRFSFNSISIKYTYVCMYVHMLVQMQRQQPHKNPIVSKRYR